MKHYLFKLIEMY